MEAVSTLFKTYVKANVCLRLFGRQDFLLMTNRVHRVHLAQKD